MFFWRRRMGGELQKCSFLTVVGSVLIGRNLIFIIILTQILNHAYSFEAINGNIVNSVP